MAIACLGLASGDPIFPVWIEETGVALAGILPVALMQRYRPFCIFSILVVALPPEQLSEWRRRILAAFRTRENLLLTGLTALLLYFTLLQAYRFAPVVEGLTPIHAGGVARLSGLLLAAVGFFGANLFLQVSLAAMRVLTFSDRELEALDPVPTDAIASQFSLFGWQRSNLLQSYWPEADIVPSAEVASPDPKDKATAEAESARQRLVTQWNRLLARLPFQRTKTSD
jgi:hypothetical protein